MERQVELFLKIAKNLINQQEAEPCNFSFIRLKKGQIPACWFN